jgi:ribosome-associated translation inhibitor RaiA
MSQLHIAVRNTDLPPALESDVRTGVARLARQYRRIVRCAVRIEVPQRRRHSDAARYRVRLDLTLPRRTLAITRQPRAELRTALQDAFSTAQRRLAAYAGRMNGALKGHRRGGDIT